MQQTPVINITAGDTAPAMTFSLVRADGTSPDLTPDNTEVLFVISSLDTGLHTNDPVDDSVSNVCTIIDPTAGLVTYQWNPGGTDAPLPGFYAAKLRIMYNGTERESADVTINAEADI